MSEPAAPFFDVHLHLTRYWPDPPRTFYRPDLDFSVTGLQAEMQSQGIGAGLVLAEEHIPTVEETLNEGREHLKASHGRLLLSSTIDPTLGEEAVAHAVELWEKADDLAAIKLYPGYRRFYPHDPRLDPVYEYAERCGRVVLLHQGDTLDPHGLIKYARPIEVDEVAVQFRKVRFVLCHFGNPWIEEATEVVYKNENVFADTSGLFWPPRAPYYPAMIERAGRRIQNALATLGSCERVLYGSDWPLESLEVAVGLIQRLNLPAEDKAKILGGNARRIFAPFLV
jgi:uncharacterized protein